MKSQLNSKISRKEKKLNYFLIKLAGVFPIFFLIVLFLSYLAFAGDKIEEYQLLNFEGFILLEEGELDLSIKYFQKAIEKNPEYAIAYNNLGCAYYRLGKYKMATKFFREAIDIEKRYTKAYFNLASSYFRKGNYLKAFSYYVEAKEIDQKYIEIRLDFDQAEEELKKLISERPDDKFLREILQRLENRK